MMRLVSICTWNKQISTNFFFCAGSFSELPLVPQIAEVIKEDLWPNPLTYFSHVTSLLPYLPILDNKFGY